MRHWTLQRTAPVLHAYRLVYPLSQHGSPQLWEYEQPYIDNLLLNAGRLIDLSHMVFRRLDSTRPRQYPYRDTYYRPKPLFDHMPTWQDWFPEYRQLIIEVQDMVKEHTSQGTWSRRPSRRGYSA